MGRKTSIMMAIAGACFTTGCVVAALGGGALAGVHVTSQGAEADEPRQPRPSDFDGKPIWARTFVISAGVIMNMLFAFVVYTGVNATWGLRELAENRVGRVRADLLPSGAEALAELVPGARLVSVGDRQVVQAHGDLRQLAPLYRP